MWVCFIGARVEQVVLVLPVLVCSEPISVISNAKWRQTCYALTGAYDLLLMTHA